MHRPKRQDIAPLLSKVLDRALSIQEPTIHAYIDRARQFESEFPNDDPTHQSASDSGLIHRLERQYLASITAVGAAAGAAAAVPGVGIVALPINLAEVGTFIEATSVYVLALAAIHGIPVTDIERRRTLVLAVLIGQAGSGIVTKIAGRTGPHWARYAVNGVPLGSIRAINKVLGRNFVTKYGTKQGILVLGRELPLGIGALIGGAGNAGLAYMSVRAARQAFGPPTPQRGTVDAFV